MDLFSLEGRVALVTGGGRGIGRGIAGALSAQGAKVVCAARTRSQLDETVAAIEADAGEAWALEMDMADLSSVTGGVEAVVSHYGQIDILVNNAGINIVDTIEEVTEEHYDQIMDVNLKGLYFLTQAVVKHMIPRKRGKVINIGSLATGTALAKISVYTAAKGAVGLLTKAQALELAAHNIQANAICPGFVITPLTAELWEDPGMKAWLDRVIPQKRLAKPSDIVGTAVFLASPASDYVTGQLIYVDGGFTTGHSWPLPSGDENT